LSDAIADLLDAARTLSEQEIIRLAELVRQKSEHFAEMLGSKG
jgi:hypothetical protein